MASTMRWRAMRVQTSERPRSRESTMLRGTLATNRRDTGDARSDLARRRVLQVERYAVNTLPSDPLRSERSVLPAVRSHELSFRCFALDHAGEGIFASRNTAEMPAVSTLGSDADHEDNIECRWFHSLRVHPQFGGRLSAITPFDKTYPRSLARPLTSPHPAHSGAGVSWTLGERELRLPSRLVPISWTGKVRSWRLDGWVGRPNVCTVDVRAYCSASVEVRDTEMPSHVGVTFRIVGSAGRHRPHPRVLPTALPLRSPRSRGKKSRSLTASTPHPRDAASRL